MILFIYQKMTIDTRKNSTALNEAEFWYDPVEDEMDKTRASS